MACPAPNKADQFVIAFEIVPQSNYVRGALERIDNWLSSYGLDSDCRGNTQLVIAEALNNIVEHGRLQPDQVIHTSIALTHLGIKCCLRDEAPTFRALDGPVQGAPVSNAAIELAEGGYGLILIQTLARDIRYVEVERGNHLEFLIPLITHSEQIY